MYILYGIEKYLQTETAEGAVMGQKRHAVAMFDKEKDILEYIEKSKLSSYSPFAPIDSPEQQFNENSLLHGFHLAQVDAKGQFPLNPTMNGSYE